MDSNVALFLACTCAKMSSWGLYAMCRSTLTFGPHSSGENVADVRLCIAPGGFPLLYDLELRVLSLLESFTSFPNKAEAIPCNDVHGEPQNPVADAEGEYGRPLEPILPNDLFGPCTTSGARVLEVDREGCVDGRGEAALELIKDEVVESNGLLRGGGMVSSVSNSSSTEIRRRFRGRKVAEVLAACCWVFMATEALWMRQSSGALRNQLFVLEHFRP